MNFLTDFADQAVVLPLIAIVALMLALLGWRRGAIAWLVAVGTSFAAVLLLKLVLAACGAVDVVPQGLGALRSPSGHAAAAAVIAGGITVVLRRGKGCVTAIAAFGALLIGATRVVLGLHSVVEVAVGGALGVSGAVGFAWLAGMPPALRPGRLLAAVVAVALLLHGRHLDAEARIRAVAFSLPFCHQAAPIESQGDPAGNQARP